VREVLLRTFRPLVVLLLLAGLAACSPTAGREQADILVSGGMVVTMDGSRRVLERGAVAIRGEHILDVGPDGELRQRYAAARTLNAEGTFVLPGLVNTHTHAPMVLFRGIANDVALMDWLQKYIFPAEAASVTPDFVEAGTALACLEMIRSGTTTYADMYYFEEQVAAVTEKAGMRAVLGETIIGSPSPDSRTPEQALAYTERFIRRWKGNTLITPAVSPHAPYTNSAATLKACKILADRYGVPLTIHVSETRDEVRQVQQTYGRTSTQWLDSLGMLGPLVLFCHVVWPTEEDLALIQARGVGVSHNPESNMMLASGAAPVVRMLALGIPVGLGTDGAVSNNNLDMFEAMDFAGKLHKLVNMDPAAITAERILEMATLGGARVLGLEREIGSLEAGKKADLILVNGETEKAIPLYDPYRQLVYSLKGNDVQASIINGKVIMLEGRALTLDEKLVRQKARDFGERIRNSASIQ